jgi:hypothetical protein
MRWRWISGTALLLALAVGASGQSGKDDDTTALEAQQLIGQALDRISEADSDGAMALLRQALALNSDSFQGHFWLAYLARQRAGSDLEMKRLAIEHLQAALAIIPRGDAAQCARSLLVKLTGRPSDVSLIISAPASSAGDAPVQATKLVAQTMCGQGGLSFASMVTRTVASPLAGRVEDTGHMQLLTGKLCPLASLNQDDLTSLVREVAGTGQEGGLKCGWLVGLSPVNLAAARIPNGQQVMDLPGYARMLMTVVDPIDARVIGTFEVSTGSLQYALPTLLVSRIASKAAPLAKLLGLGGDSNDVTCSMLTCLAAQTQHRLSRLTTRLKERDLRDEIALPVEGGRWILSTAKTPREALSAPRVAIAPVFCPDITAEQMATDCAEDAAAAISGAGMFSVIPASQFQRGVEEIREEAADLPLLRCYEQIARKNRARYLLLTWFDDFQSTVESKNLTGSQAVVRAVGHLAVQDVEAGGTVMAREFSYGSRTSEFVGDVAEKYLLAVEAVTGQVAKAISDAVAAIDGGTREG